MFQQLLVFVKKHEIINASLAIISMTKIVRQNNKVCENLYYCYKTNNKYSYKDHEFY